VEGCDGLVFRLNRPARALTEPLARAGAVDPPEYGSGRVHCNPDTARGGGTNRSVIRGRGSRSAMNGAGAIQTIGVAVECVLRAPYESAGDAERARNGDHKGASPGSKVGRPEGCLFDNIVGCRDWREASSYSSAGAEASLRSGDQAFEGRRVSPARRSDTLVTERAAAMGERVSQRRGDEPKPFTAATRLLAMNQDLSTIEGVLGNPLAGT